MRTGQTTHDGSGRGGRGKRHERPSDERQATGDDTGLYVHVPVCRSKCRYCGFYSLPAVKVDVKRLVRALAQEMERHDGRAVRTAYIGGGSPTALPANELIGLVRSVRKRCPQVEEFTVECNPGQVDEPLLAGLRAAGVNRLSFGAQSFRTGELELLGRRHSVGQIGRSVRLARQAGFRNVGLDLIFAIPGSTLTDWRVSLEAAIRLNVEHVSAYSLSFEPGTVFDRWRRAGRLAPVDEEADRAMYEWAIERLERAGLAQYEISNFARPGCECRHNMGYWRNRPFIGIGPGAASWRPNARPGTSGSSLGRDDDAPRAACRRPSPGPGVSNADTPACNDSGHVRGGSLVSTGGNEPGQGRRDRLRTDANDQAQIEPGINGREQGWRGENEADVERYVAAVEAERQPPGQWEAIGEAEAVCETAVLNLRARDGIDRAEFQQRTGREAMAVFGEPIRRYCQLGLIEVTDQAVRLTRRALPIADSLLCDFAALE